MGTTVRATDFLRDLPVRKQMALKAVPKCLARINRLLQSYALARPIVRISMKVLKSKNEKGFLYAPSIGSAKVEDAVCKIFGKDCASNCVWSILHSNGFEIQAFLPNADANPLKISNVGQYLSVDSRPVCTSRGTFKQIAVLFKAKLRVYNSRFDGVKHPFLYLNINCPKASYDLNVEPAKDDVLFDDSSKVVTAVEELLSQVYPAHKREISELETAVPCSRIVKAVSAPENITQHTQAFEANDLPSTRIGSPSTRYNTNINPEDEEIVFLEQRAKVSTALRENMYGIDEDDLELLTFKDNRPSSVGSEHPSEVARDITVSNPWTIAKMNAHVRSTACGNSVPSAIYPSQASINSDRPTWEFTSPSAEIAVSSPSRTSFPYPYGNSTEMHDTDRGLSAVTRTPFPIPQSRSGRLQKEHPMDDFSTARSSPLHLGHPPLMQHGLPTPQPSSSPVHAKSFGTPLNAIPEVPRRKKQLSVRASAHKASQPRASAYDWNVPFDTSSSARERIIARGSRERRNHDIRNMIAGSIARSAALITQGEPNEKLSEQDISPDVINHRLDGVIFESQQTRRMTRPASTIADDIPDEELLVSVPATPRLKIRENLAKQTTDVTLAPTRRRTTESRRTKSSRLPLERIPDNAQTQDVILQYSISASTICSSMSKLDVSMNFISWQEIAQTAYHAFSIPPDTVEVKQWTRRIMDGVLHNCDVENGEDAEEVEGRIVAALLAVEWS
jgi:hypothetical protein